MKYDASTTLIGAGCYLTLGGFAFNLAGAHDLGSPLMLAGAACCVLTLPAAIWEAATAARRRRRKRALEALRRLGGG